MSQTAATLCIQVPTLDASDAIHSARNVRWRSGVQADAVGSGPAGSAGASALRAIVKFDFRARQGAAARPLYEAACGPATKPAMRHGEARFTSRCADAKLPAHAFDPSRRRGTSEAGATTRLEAALSTAPPPIAAPRTDLAWLARRAAVRVRSFFGEQNRALFVELVRAAFKNTDHNSIAGALWSLLAPFAMLTALYLVFRDRFGEELRAYPLYLLVGIAVVNYFATATRLLITILFNNRPMLLNTTVPRETVILAQVAFHGYKFLVEMALCMLLALHYGTFTWHGLLTALPLLLAFLGLITGIGMIGAVLFSFARDTEHIWTLVTHLLMFVTPVFYGLDSLSAPARFIIYWLNPLTPFLVALRGALIGPPAHPGVQLHALLIGTVVLVAGYAAFLSAESSAMERT
jgi:ABC-type polysaccharide/polyol phosphate export permease